MNHSAGIDIHTNNNSLPSATGKHKPPSLPTTNQLLIFFHSLTAYLESCLDEGVFTFANSSAEMLSDQVSSNVLPFPMLLIVLSFTFNLQKHHQTTAHYWAQSQSTLPPSLSTPQFSTLFPEFGYQMSPHFVPDISPQMMATSSESDDLSGIPSSSIYLPSILPNAPTTEDYPTLNTMVPYAPPISQNFNNLQQQVYNTSSSLAGQGPPALR